MPRSAVVAVQFTDSSGASAWGTVWSTICRSIPPRFTGMPYCELNFTQSPAQLLVTGLQGDVTAMPATLSLGTYTAGAGSQQPTESRAGAARAEHEAPRAHRPVFTATGGTGPWSIALDSTALRRVRRDQQQHQHGAESGGFWASAG